MSAIKSRVFVWIVLAASMCLHASTITGKAEKKAKPGVAKKSSTFKLIDPLKDLEIGFFLPEPQSYELPSEVKRVIAFFIKTNPQREQILRDEYKSIMDNPNDIAIWIESLWEDKKYTKYFLDDYNNVAVKALAEAEVKCEMYKLDCDKVSHLKNELELSQKRGAAMWFNLLNFCKDDIKKWAKSIN